VIGLPPSPGDGVPAERTGSDTMAEQVRGGAEGPQRPVVVTGGVTELALLIPAGELAALEERARREGVTTGQLIRRILRASLADGTAPRRPPCRTG
jgi:hypothetical protein